MSECKIKSTPIEHNLKLKLSEGTPPKSQLFRELIGCLTYLTVITRSDICFAVSYFSRLQSQTTEESWIHLKCVLRYLKKTKDLKLIYKDSSAPILQAYSDADWAGDINSRKSTSGFVIKVFGNLIQWASRKQNCVALSTCEAEYVALSITVSEVLWIQKLLLDLGFDTNQFTPTEICEDNQSVICVAQLNKYDNKLKHVDIKINFVQDILCKGFIYLKYVESDNQQADIFTKSLNIVQFNKFINVLGYDYV